MMKDQTLSIGGVVQLTGLTERALRFYEERGLLKPSRTQADRRVYGAGDLKRIHAITALQRAGYSLDRIKGLLGADDFAEALLVDVQLEALRAERKSIDLALAALSSVKAALADGVVLDLDTLCQLIKIGEQNMKNDAWKKVYDKYYTPEEQENWKAAKDKLSPDFDQKAYEQQWRDLAAAIEAALPLAPGSDEAQQLLKQWNDLLAPFMAVADDQMKAGANRLWEDMDNWPEGVESPISKEVWAFISAANSAKA
ncbi:MAG: MerR family transcriptional regulator [Alphaproteobacteria bacterium]|nr:MerR family transcriptional regulator [Alphaproteobacteria bacterium]